MLKYVGPLIVVENIARSRHFYEDILGQKVEIDFGPNVSFVGNFSIHLKSHFQELLGGAARVPVTKKAHNGELYFEADEIEAVYQDLKQAGVEFIHGIQEQPWGQRVIRFYDPDGYVIESGETMEAAVGRLHRQGMTIEQVQAKTGMPIEFVQHVLKPTG